MLLSPLLISTLIEHYTWRGALLLHAALASHTIPLGMTFCQPSSSKSPTTKTAFDLSMGKDRVFIVYCLGSFLIRINSTAIITHLPSFLVREGFTLEQSAMVASVSGGLNVLARFLASFMASLPRFDAAAAYGVAMVVNCTATVLLLLLPGFKGKCTASAIFGFSFGKYNNVFL